MKRKRDIFPLLSDKYGAANTKTWSHHRSSVAH